MKKIQTISGHTYYVQRVKLNGSYRFAFFKNPKESGTSGTLRTFATLGPHIQGQLKKLYKSVV